MLVSNSSLNPLPLVITCSQVVCPDVGTPSVLLWAPCDLVPWGMIFSEVMRAGGTFVPGPPPWEITFSGLKQKCGDTFFSGKPVFPPPVDGPYGKAKIRLKPDPRVYRHQECALRGERKEAMEKIFREFINRGWSPVTAIGPPTASSSPRRWPGNGSWWLTTAA